MNLKRIQAGFTLIELLVVISIMGLLLSVIIVSLNGARIKSQNARAQVNIEKVQSAMEFYYSEHGGYPSSKDTNGNNACCTSGNSCLFADTEYKACAVSIVASLPLNNNNLLAAVGDIAVSSEQFTINGKKYTYGIVYSCDPTGVVVLPSGEEICISHKGTLSYALKDRGVFSIESGIKLITDASFSGSASSSVVPGDTIIPTDTPSYPGCTNPAATNYNPSATSDDGSCSIPPGGDLTGGCTDPTATNYDSENIPDYDDGSCYLLGCTDATATNYNEYATIEDASCEYATPIPLYSITTNASGPIAFGGQVNVFWTGPYTTNDWIALYRVGASKEDYYYPLWMYTNASPSSYPFYMPSASGTYEFRLNKNNGYETVATSSPIVVTNCPSTSAPYTLTHNVPGSIQAPGIVRVTWNAGIYCSEDWIGLFPLNSDNHGSVRYFYTYSKTGYVDISTINSSSGQNLPDGFYQFRYMKENGYVSATSSAPFEINACPAANPNTISHNVVGTLAQGDTYTISWTGQYCNQDWIGLFNIGADINNSINANYINSSPSSQQSAGINYTTGQYANGTVELRYYRHNGTTPIATSTPFNIGYTLTTSAGTGSVPRGSTLTVTWTGKYHTNDWIGLYSVGASNYGSIDWKYVTPGDAGSLTLTTPQSVGSYEVRYFKNNEYDLAITSSAFTVNSSGSSGSSSNP